MIHIAWYNLLGWLAVAGLLGAGIASKILTKGEP